MRIRTLFAMKTPLGGVNLQSLRQTAEEAIREFMETTPYVAWRFAKEAGYDVVRVEVREVTQTKIIIGQEVICPHGLGRVVSVENAFGWITVSTYVDDRGCKWAPDNIELIDPRGSQ